MPHSKGLYPKQTPPNTQKSAHPYSTELNSHKGTPNFYPHVFPKGSTSTRWTQLHHLKGLLREEGKNHKARAESFILSPA